MLCIKKIEWKLKLLQKFWQDKERSGVIEWVQANTQTRCSEREDTLM